MFRIMASALLVAATAAPAQTESYDGNKPAPINAESNKDKIVCKKEEKIGTRLGATRTCLTVAEWRERHLADREMTEKIQSGVRICANPPCD